MGARHRPSWYHPDMGLAARMLLTMFLLGAVYVVFAVILGAVFNLPWIVLAVMALAIASVQFFFADKIALASMHARMVSEQEAPTLHDLVGRLAAQANLPKPRIAVIQSTVPNAFATGRDKHHAVVAVTTALLDHLSPPELEAVLAHELTHIINRDMLVMTLATFFSMVAALVLRNVYWLGAGGGVGGGGNGRRRNQDGESVLLVALAAFVTYALSFLLIRALSRYRELAADRGSALITGAPENLATALIRIDGLVRGPEGARIPQKDFREAQTVSALCILPVVRGGGDGGGDGDGDGGGGGDGGGSGRALQTIFSTHPSLNHRLEQLQRLQAQMEAAHVAV